MAEKESIDSQTAMKTAHLSRLTLNDEQAQHLAHKCSTILDSFEVVQSVEVGDVVDHREPLGRDELRKDESRPSLGQEKALEGAPQSFNGHFRVPAVLT